MSKLVAALEITVPTLGPIPLKLPKIPITQLPIAVPELLLASEHRLDDLDQAGDRLDVIPYRATNNDLPFGNIVCILNNINLPEDVDLDPFPAGTLDGRLKNDD